MTLAVTVIPLAIFCADLNDTTHFTFVADMAHTSLNIHFILSRSVDSTALSYALLAVDDYGGLPQRPSHIHKVVMTVPVEDKATCFIPQVPTIPEHEVAVQCLECIGCVV